MPIDLIAPGRLRVGINRQSTADMGSRFVAENDTRGENHFDQYSADALGPDLVLGKARGTAAAPADVQQNDQLGVLQYQGQSTTRFKTASVEAYVDAAVVAGQRPASRLEFRTNLNNTAPALCAYLSKEGRLGIGPFDPTVAATTAGYPVHVVLSGSGSELYHTIENYDAANNATYRAGRARGTFAAPATIATGDILGELEFFAYTNQWHHCAEIQSVAGGVITPGVVPDSDLRFQTTTGGTLTLRTRIMPDGQMVHGAAALLSDADIAAQGIGKLWIANSFDTNALAIQYANNSANSPTFYSRKARGSLSAPANVQNNDNLLYFQASAYSGQWFDNLAAVAVYIDAAVVNNQRPATRIALRTQANNDGGPSDRVVVYSNGAVLIGSNAVDTSRLLTISRPTDGFAPLLVEVTGGGGTANVVRLNGGDNSTTGSNFMAFHRPDGTQIGTIKQNAANTVQYNTSSDERLKENIRDMAAAHGVEVIRAIRPRRFNYKGDSSKADMHGFIAQELFQVLPEIVSVGGGDPCACDLSDGKGHLETCCNANPWGVDYGRLSPLLVKAIQELDARISTLEAK